MIHDNNPDSKAQERIEGTSLFAVDHVQLAMPAGQEDAARGFYGGILGFDERPKPPEFAKRGGVWFQCGEIALHLGVEEPFVPAKKAHPALRCAGFDRFLKHLAAHGVEVRPDDHPFEGKRHCYIADPFGNRIELIES
ncbi:MAG TPA: VOC family protein [Verrucomicrobiae bacterium]|jgi:catechol 2,3-dioxygenase-like lactoylglutathione lyase family enzyme|nr:VOC family protein [Verrucomicrobiae bacterium]